MAADLLKGAWHLPYPKLRLSLNCGKEQKISLRTTEMKAFIQNGSL